LALSSLEEFDIFTIFAPRFIPLHGRRLKARPIPRDVSREPALFMKPSEMRLLT